jgi:hypothetical protein
MDECDVTIPMMIDRLPIEPYRTMIGLVDSGQQLDDRGLAGAVLAQQRQNLSLLRGEGDVVNRERVAKAFTEVPQL